MEGTTIFLPRGLRRWLTLTKVIAITRQSFVSGTTHYKDPILTCNATGAGPLCQIVRTFLINTPIRRVTTSLDCCGA